MNGILLRLLPAAWVAVGFFLFAWLESRRPLRRRVEGRLRRTGRNFASAGLSLVFTAPIQVLLFLPVAALAEEHRLGLLGRIPLPAPLRVLLGFLLLDYTLWIWHWLNHRVRFFWRFHLVHHVDLDLDASTGLRFHFGELSLAQLYRCLQVLVIGPGAAAFTLWQTLLLVSVLFHHSNLRLPIGIERRLVHLLVTPRMHGIHHSTLRHQRDRNYASLLTIWDRLHRTLCLGVAQSEVRIGVPGHLAPEQVTFGKVQLLPFRPLPAAPPEPPTPCPAARLEA